jgi:hypothetical protein
MALEVIGTGMGRTGTMSLKVALEQLGFGKCYHMFELFQHPEDIVYFQKAVRGEAVDWDKLFEGYHSAVDMPVNVHYKELMTLYHMLSDSHHARCRSVVCECHRDNFWATKPSLGRTLNLVLRMPFSPVLRKRLKVMQYDGRMMDRVWKKPAQQKK